MHYDWDFSALIPFLPSIFRGFLVTLELTALSIAAGTLLGVLGGIMMRSRVVAIRVPLIFVSDIIRSLPILVLLLGTNYFLPTLINMPSLSPFAIAFFALSLNLAVFIADVVRGGIANLAAGEIDAARALGFPPYQVLWRFQAPRVTQLCLPTFALLCIATAKNSALASVVAVADLTHTINLIVTDKMKSLEAYSVVAVLYIAMILPLSMFARRMERSLGFKEIDA
ncbi:MAG: amino acid ABC transporter permease [Bryobacteraceae bacterium]|jgi:polar amino acid transport system permease protein